MAKENLHVRKNMRNDRDTLLDEKRLVGAFTCMQSDAVQQYPEHQERQALPPLRYYVAMQKYVPQDQRRIGLVRKGCANSDGCRVRGSC
jgi:hypothetical protein